MVCKVLVIYRPFEIFEVPWSYLSVSSMKDPQNTNHNISLVISSCTNNCFKGFVFESEIQSSIFHKQRKTSLSVPDRTEMKTGTPFCCLMIDKL